jgi:hypothetical protein
MSQIGALGHGMGGLWDVQDILGLFWDCFGRLVMGMLNRQNVFGTCLGCMFGMCLGHVCDILPFPKPFPKLCCCGNPSHKLRFGRPFGTCMGLPQHLWEVLFGTQLGCVWELRLGGLFGKVPYRKVATSLFRDMVGKCMGHAWDRHAYIRSRGLFWNVPYLSDLGNTFGKCWGHACLRACTGVPHQFVATHSFTCATPWPTLQR